MAKKTTIAGNTFLFTGRITKFTREDAEAHVEAEGGKVLSGVSAKLDYLVVGEDAGSKLKKAEDLGTVTILHEKEFLKLMNSGKNESSIRSKKTQKLSTNMGVIEGAEIGKQIWMTKNLEVVRFTNGVDIHEAKNLKQWLKNCRDMEPAWCYCDFDSKNQKFGRLYNWYAVNGDLPLAPEGCAVPKEKDWQVLMDSLGGDNIAGEKLKSNIIWNKKVVKNESGFNALPGSFLPSESSAWNNGIGNISAWWSSSYQQGSTNVYFLVLENNSSVANLTTTYWSNSNDILDGYYVRLIKQ
jgi:uncharacterized protein (TIGR02145 family)